MKKRDKTEYPRVAASVWAKRWNLAVIVEPCDECGADLKTTIPAQTRDWIWLESPDCSCGEGSKLSVGRGRTAKKRQELASTYQDLKYLLS